MKNQNLAIKLIQKDCHIRGKLLDENGFTCAVGALALASGVTRKHLLNQETLDMNGEIKIAKKFGLVNWQLSQIISRNDDEPRLRDRRREVIKFLRTIPED
jgi:hypothetical protein